MAKKFRQTEVDKGYDKLLKAVRKFTAWRGAIDVRDEQYGSGVSTRQVAEWHLRGTSRMPKRDFLTDWWTSSGEKQLRRDQRRAARRLVTKANVRQTRRELASAGKRAVKGVREAMARQQRLADSTIAQKGHGRVLYDTGKLTRAIYFKPVD